MSMIGKYYLVDAGYGAKPGFLPPFRATRYHLNEWGNHPVENERELFNLRHSSLRMKVECAFGSLKRRFKVLDEAKPFHPYPCQVDIVQACCIIHNWVLSDGADEFFVQDENNNQTYLFMLHQQVGKLENIKKLLILGSRSQMRCGQTVNNT